MKPAFMLKRYAGYGLAGINLLLLGGLAYLWVDADGHLRNLIWLPPAAQSLTLDPVSLQRGAASADADVGRFVVIVDRPLFSSTRRPPPPPPPPPPPKPVDPLADLKIVGVYKEGDSGGILANLNGKVRRMRVGETIGEWKIQEVRGRDVVFVRGTEFRTLSLTPAPRRY